MLCNFLISLLLSQVTKKKPTFNKSETGIEFGFNTLANTQISQILVLKKNNPHQSPSQQVLTDGRDERVHLILGLLVPDQKNCGNVLQNDFKQTFDSKGAFKNWQKK